MKYIDPIKNLSAKDLANGMLDDIECSMQDLSDQLSATADIDQVKAICSKLCKYKFMAEYIKDYIKPIELSVEQQYKSLKTQKEKDQFIKDEFGYIDPFNILASGVLTEADLYSRFAVSTPENPDTYDIWSVIDVGSDYVKIMPDMPIRYINKYGIRLVKTPVVIIGVGMTYDEVSTQIMWAYSNEK